MSELLNHQHCRVCDRATQFGDSTCADHIEEYQALQKKRKRNVRLFYVATAVMVVFLLMQLSQQVRP